VHAIWSQCCYSVDGQVAAKGVQLLVRLASLRTASSHLDLALEASLAVESLVLVLCAGDAGDADDAARALQLRTVLASAVHLCRVSAAQPAALQMVECLTRLLVQAKVNSSFLPNLTFSPSCCSCSCCSCTFSLPNLN